jgi:Ca-activated chloride channel family protein
MKAWYFGIYSCGPPSGFPTEFLALEVRLADRYPAISVAISRSRFQPVRTQKYRIATNRPHASLAFLAIMLPSCLSGSSCRVPAAEAVWDYVLEMQTGALLRLVWDRAFANARDQSGFKRLEDNVGLNFIFRVSCIALVVGSCPYLVPAQTPVFRATTNLQSIAVQVVDKKGNFVPGLTVDDFTLLEDGLPQKIAFFGTHQQPVSLAILLDSSRSMDFGRKFDRARELLAPLIAGHHPDDQIFFAPFMARIDAFEQLTRAQRLHPELIQTSRDGVDRGTALYDALASALCRMGTAGNLRQALVVITDGADQHSRLNLEQLIELAQMSNLQTFMIGFFSRAESKLFDEGHKTITLIGEREIDNPVIVFDRLAKESGAESFFPSSEQDLKAALDRISELLEAQYTLAYYPENVDRFRRIEVRVRRRGVKVITRHGVGSSSAGNPVHFEASTCEVSAPDHPYAWELKSTQTPSGDLLYHEDFSDPNSGWPNRREEVPVGSARFPQHQRGYRPGMRYIPGGYEISRNVPANLTSSGPILDGDVVAYGPPWDNMGASVSVQTDWTRTFRPQRDKSSGGCLASHSYSEIAPGLVFHLNPDGYYASVLAGTIVVNSACRPVRKIIQFKLVRTLFSDDGASQDSELIPWTQVSSSVLDPQAPIQHTTEPHKISVEYRGGQIAVMVDDRQAGSIHDDRLPNGLAGLAVFGKGEAIFHDLLVQDLH